MLYNDELKAWIFKNLSQQWDIRALLSSKTHHILEAVGLY